MVDAVDMAEVMIGAWGGVSARESQASLWFAGSTVETGSSKL